MPFSPGGPRFNADRPGLAEAESFDRRVDEIGNRPSAGGGSGDHPFKIVNASSGGTAKVRVVFGAVNNLTPTIGGVPIDNSTPPDAIVVTGHVYLEVTLNTNGAATAAIIDSAGSLPSDTATKAYITLATVTVSAGNVTAISQAVTHSLMVRRCGVSDMHFWGV